MNNTTSSGEKVIKPVDEETAQRIKDTLQTEFPDSGKEIQQVVWLRAYALCTADAQT